MNQVIHFGWELDGFCFPESHLKDPLFTEIMGPQGLLQVLEYKLGCSYPQSPRSTRVAQYLARLRKLDSGSEFYSRSFSVDPWATASYLLHRRDQLKGSGWQGERVEDCGPRLSLIQNIESLDLPQICPGLNDRLANLVRELKRTNHSFLPEIQSSTPFRFLPSAFRSLFSSLREQGTLFQEIEAAPACQAGDLAVLQKSISGQSGPLAARVCGDGSFVILESDNEVEAAEFVAAWLSAQPAFNQDLVILRGTGTSMLDEACHRVGLPRIGGERKSRFRGAMQVLPLAIENLWAPMNPVGLIQFLSLPQLPIPRRAAYWFSEALRIEPGLGGEAWKTAWVKVEESLREKLEDRGLKGQSLTRQLNKEMSNIREWLNAGRFSREKTIPSIEVIKLCRKVESWAAQKSAESHDDLLISTSLQAKSIIAAIQESSLTQLTKLETERIIDESVEEGVGISGGGAESSEWSLIDSPGQLWGPCASLLWWGFVGGEERGEQRFWTRKELTALEQRGIRLDEQGLSKLRSGDACKRALLNTREQLILVRPRSARGQLSHPHQFWPQVKMLLQRCSPSQLLVRDTEQLLSVPDCTVGKRTIYLEAGVPQSLPVPSREWHISAGLIGAPEQESFTSIDTLLRCPLAWVLGYTAKMRPGTVLDCPEGERLIGNLAHAVFAKMVAEKKAWAKEEARLRSQEIFDQICPAIAAPLLMPEMRLEHKRARLQIGRAIATLFDLITGAQLSILGSEVHHCLPFAESNFVGWLDLVCLDRNDACIVIDLKWSRSASYRIKEIREGKALQLATYNWLQNHNSPEWPGAGYYMLKQSRMLFSSSQPFPHDTYIPGTDLREIWGKAEKEYLKNLDLLKCGKIIAPGVGEAVEDEEADHSYNGNELALEPPCRVCSFSNICGKKD